VDADDLAEIGGELLRRLETLPVAGRDEELAVGREHQPSAEMPAADRLRLLSPYDSHVAQLHAVELAARDGRALEHGIGQVLKFAEPGIGVVAIDRRLLFGRLAVRQVDEAIAREIRIYFDVQQTALILV